MRPDLPKQVPLLDPASTRALRETREALRDLQDRTRGRYLEVDGSPDILLLNGRVNRLLHGEDRPVTWAVRKVRGATATGRIVEVDRDSGDVADPARDLWLDVQGFGADITVRIWVD